MEEIAQVYARVAVRGRQGARQARRRPRAARRSSPTRSTQNRELRCSSSRRTSPPRRRRTGLHRAVDGRRPGGRELPRAADREPPHAGRSSASAASTTRCGTRRTSCCRSRSRARSSSTSATVERIGERDRRADRPARSSSTSTVDPDILGGIVLRVGNSILDASIRNRLEQLRKQVAHGLAPRHPRSHEHHADQARRDHLHPQEPHRGPRRRRAPS